MITPEQTELIDEVTSAAANVAVSHEWGSGVASSERDLTEARNALEGELARLNAEIERLNNDHSAAHALVAQYHDYELTKEFLAGSKIIDKKDAEIERLRGLIKRAEWGHDDISLCPWCGGYNGEEHYDCPAFTPDGVVK